MLLTLVKRRWPVLTTVIAALIYAANNYDIHGLESLRLEPRRTDAPANLGFAQQGNPWAGALGSGPRLPSTSTQSPWSQGNPATYVSNAPLQATQPFANENRGLGRSAASGMAPLSGAAGGDWGQALSIGEKLAMLDRAHAPATVNETSYLGAATHAGAGGASPLRDTVRIASFNLHGWGDAKRDNVLAAEVLTRLLGQFDIVALQDIRSRQDDVLPELVRALNSQGRRYDFMIGPRVGRTERREQLGFVFDTERIQTDRFQLYTVDDPEDMLYREPLVGWFRTICPVGQEAFTFSLINLHIEPDLVQRELQTLPNLLQAILNDGRAEDDLILAGDFSASAPELRLLAASGMRIAIDGIASTTRGSQLLDNFAFPETSTTEYTGRSGAVDFLRLFNLSLEQAVQVSEHLPIWAEFSIIEGGRPGQVAGNASPMQGFRSGIN